MALTKLLSPGIEVNYYDLTRVPALGQNRVPIAAIAGVFPNGPINEPTLIRSVGQLETVFGEPDGGNDETFFTAASYLAYSNQMYVIRVANNAAAPYTKTKTEIDTISVFSQTGVFSNSDVINILGGVTYTAANVSVTTNANGVITSLALVNNGIYLSSDFPTSGDGLLNVVANNISNSTPTLTVNLTYKPVSTADQTAISINSYLKLAPNGKTIVDDTQWRSQITNNGYAADTDVLWVGRSTGSALNGYRISVCDSSNASINYLGKPWAAAAANVIFVQGSRYANIVTANAATANTLSAAFSYRDRLSFERAPTVVGGSDGVARIYNQIVSKKIVGANVALTFEKPFPAATTQSIIYNGGFKYPTSNNKVIMYRHWEFFGKAFDIPQASDRGTDSELKRVSGATTTFVNDRVQFVVADKDNKVVYKSDGTRAITSGLSAEKKTLYGESYHTEINNDITNTFVWWANHRPGLVRATPATMQNLDTLPYHAFLGAGLDSATEDTVSLSSLMTGYGLLKDKDTYDVDYILTGKPNGGTYGEGLINYIVGEICEVRKDCMVFGSPKKADVTESLDNSIPDKISLYADAVVRSSFAVIDSGYKTIYNKYTDTRIDVPMNGDTAGLVASTTQTVGPWYSPAGYNRGTVKNIINLVYSPTQADRDIIYPNAVNPYIRINGGNPILFGDKTTFNDRSAFSRINVRQLFIYLQRTISNVAKFSLFEFNDEFTRAQFVGTVEPILRNVKAQRGVYDYLLVCDETNNTPDIIDDNTFVADIFIKPARSINYIQLNFVATRTGADFTEIIDSIGGDTSRLGSFRI